MVNRGLLSRKMAGNLFFCWRVVIILYKKLGFFWSLELKKKAIFSIPKIPEKQQNLRRCHIMDFEDVARSHCCVSDSNYDAV